MRIVNLTKKNVTFADETSMNKFTVYPEKDNASVEINKNTVNTIRLGDLTVTVTDTIIDKCILPPSKDNTIFVVSSFVYHLLGHIRPDIYTADGVIKKGGKFYGYRGVTRLKYQKNN